MRLYYTFLFLKIGKKNDCLEGKLHHAVENVVKMRSLINILFRITYKFQKLIASMTTVVELSHSSVEQNAVEKD